VHIPARREPNPERVLSSRAGVVIPGRGRHPGQGCKPGRKGLTPGSPGQIPGGDSNILVNRFQFPAFFRSSLNVSTCLQPVFSHPGWRADGLYPGQQGAVPGGEHTPPGGAHCGGSEPLCIPQFAFALQTCLLAHKAHPVASTSLNFPCPSRYGGLGLTCDILVACRALVRLALPIFREASRRGHGHVQRTTTNLAMVLSAGSEREHRWPSTREHMQLGSRSPISPHPQPPFPPNPDLASMERNQGYIPDPIIPGDKRTSK
jgi:hypothetical protein